MFVYMVVVVGAGGEHCHAENFLPCSLSKNEREAFLQAQVSGFRRPCHLNKGLFSPQHVPILTVMLSRMTHGCSPGDRAGRCRGCRADAPRILRVVVVATRYPGYLREPLQNGHPGVAAGPTPLASPASSPFLPGHCQTARSAPTDGGPALSECAVPRLGRPPLQLSYGAFSG